MMPLKSGGWWQAKRLLGRAKMTPPRHKGGGVEDFNGHLGITCWYAVRCHVRGGSRHRRPTTGAQTRRAKKPTKRREITSPDFRY